MRDSGRAGRRGGATGAGRGRVTARVGRAAAGPLAGFDLAQRETVSTRHSRAQGINPAHNLLYNTPVYGLLIG
ncbi:hypothetical protein CO2235_230377 [Cupriavidus oxalaticus]|uniref:Uncharacterized protein n=1 Tax=Cupriavidus oxalaticus TaxID=96344 RepID=A0A375GBP0_9BURK|nr:hypothetical protein CO2235_230377 [Cupriavidus oxalaticus]